MADVPAAARVVIIGGGIIGCSTAYHLARLGWREVVLLERAKLTSGSTFHAAGLVGQLRTNANITRLLTESVALYERLERETGQATGWKQNGGLRLACNRERMTELKRQATTARSFGLEMHILGPREARDLWPLMDIADLEGAAFLPTDGQANPSDITQAFAKGARQGGVTIIEDCAVTGFAVKNGRVAGVLTEQGDIAVEIVVNCAGQWAREVGAMAGVNVPLVSVQHQYLITDPIEGVTHDLPTLRDPDRLIYFKEEVGGLVMGGYEPNPRPWAEKGIPPGFNFSLLDPDLDHFEPLMKQALARVPALERAGVKEVINGPESFTPDGNFILGEAPERRGFYVGAGFNAFGIASSGGAGKMLAEWIVGGEPPMDLWAVDIRRFGRPHLSIDWVRKRTLELYGKHYTLAWPHEEHEAGRPNRVSPLYAALKAQGACFGEKLGWERPNWFARNGETPRDVYSYGRQNWFEAVGEEHRAVRERVGLFDQSSFAKFLMVGPDAAAALTWICANDVDKPVGAVTYTQILNDRGGIECDLTVSRLDEDQFYIVTGTGFATRDFDWIRRAIPEGSRAYLVDVTSAHATLSLMGPKARDLLTAVSDSDLSNERFLLETGGASRSAACASMQFGSPTLVNWAGSCTSPPSRRLASTSCFWKPARRTVSPMPVIARSRACAWRRAIAPGAAISARTIRLWRPASAGRSSCARISPSRDGTRWSRNGPHRSKNAWRALRWTIPRSTCSAAKPSTATAGAPVGSPPAVGATRSGKTSATATCAPATASPTIFSTAAPTSLKWWTSASPARYGGVPSTIPR